MFTLLTVGLAILSVIATALMPDQEAYRQVDAVALLLALAAPLALLLGQRSRAGRSGPLLAVGAAGAAVTLNAALGYEIGFVQWPPWIAVFLCFSHGGRWPRVGASALAWGAVGGYLLLDRGPLELGLISGIAMCFLIAAIAGDAARSRRAHAAGLEERVRAREREDALIAEGVLLQERSRLARELHDALGHSVNVMVLQAGVGRRVFSENPQFAEQALSSVETVGRSALVELDRMLRVLQPLGAGRDEEPLAPTLDDVADLVEQVRSTGREVQLRTDLGPALPLSVGVARASYRIVQEALTNAVRHGGEGPIRVAVFRQGADVVVEVRNALDVGEELAPTTAGRGLVNMRERVRLEGGQFEAGRMGDAFVVRATLPVELGTAVPPADVKVGR